MGFLDRVFRRRARDATVVDGPTRVELECRVSSPNAVQSPVSGHRGALIKWSLLEQRSYHAGRGGGVISRHELLAWGLYDTESLRMEADGRTIEVPLSQARLVLIEDPEDGEVLAALPEALRAAAAQVSPKGPLAYRETSLRHGALVRLTATLERAPPSGDYRSPSSSTADLVALPDERLVIREL